MPEDSEESFGFDLASWNNTYCIHNFFEYIKICTFLTYCLVRSGVRDDMLLFKLYMYIE